MLIVKTLLLGLIEGVTEFLPVSSTAHLILAAKALALPSSDYWKFFEIFIQSGAILAVVTLFWKELGRRDLVQKLALSFVPTALVGFGLYKIIKSLFFESAPLIATTLILFGLVFLWVELLIKRKKVVLKKTLNKLTNKDAVILGLVQALSVVPGVSRAGAVIVGGMLMGYERRAIALYSFLLAVPTIFMAAAYDLIKTNPRVLTQNWPLTLIGFVTAYLSALVVTKWLIKYLQGNSLNGFGLYRIILGLVLIFTLLLNA